MDLRQGVLTDLWMALLPDSGKPSAKSDCQALPSF